MSRFRRRLLENGTPVDTGGGLTTAVKRAASDMITLPFRTVLPSPSGTVDAAAREITGLHYPI